MHVAQSLMRFLLPQSLPVPIASHKFESMDPISGHSNSGDNTGQFVSSVCWKRSLTC
uniref:Uncharacterized protein n=1 Tax=Lotus japonicus TaxID=34305 RepID=I3SNX7_LOTJA|nr:unknown [Lotus japonicus]